MGRHSHSRGAYWLWGILLALALIFISSRSRFTPDETALQQHFAKQPTPAVIMPDLPLPQLEFERLSPDVQRAAQNIQRQIGLGQQVPALTPVVQSSRVKIDITSLRRRSNSVQIVGEVLNVSTTEVEIPIDAIELRDNVGATYGAGDPNSVHLAPGESTPLDLTVPLPEGRGLLLTLTLPPDPPVTQVLLVSEA